MTQDLLKRIFMMQKLTKQKHIFAPLMHAISLFCMQSQVSVKGNQLVVMNN